MSRLQCRGSIARVAVLVAVLSSRPADAQVVVAPIPPRPPAGWLNTVITGANYDILNQALAQRRLRILQERLRRDTDRGDFASVGRDARRIDNVNFRIAVDEWLIRKNLFQDISSTPYPTRLDPLSAAAIAYVTRPAETPYVPQRALRPEPTVAAPIVSITIVNNEPAGAVVNFAIDGVAHQSAGGSNQNLAVAPNSHITYDSGGSLGKRRYRISTGLYEFRSTAEGWALYKVTDMP